MKRLVLSICCIVILAGFAFAEGVRGRTSLEVQADYLFPNHNAVDAVGLIPVIYGVSAGANPLERSAGSSWGGSEVKAILDYRLTIPAFEGVGALTRGNNLSLDIIGEFSPVSLNANFRATLTPIAFLKLAAGAGIGTGWDIGFIGLALNNKGYLDSQSFGGLVYRAWIEGTFQFDLAAVVPGEWNHVVILASPKIQYQAYSAASGDQSWLWEADEGMNFNGLKLTGSYLLGYQMPLAIDLAGLLLQTEGWLGPVRGRSTMASSGWGSDFTYLIFGPVLDFRIDEGSSLAILTQFKTGIRWTGATTRNLDFQTRVYDAPYLYFFRLAFDYTLKL